MTTATIKPQKTAKTVNAVKRVIVRHQHKIVWIGTPLLCAAIWGMAIAAGIALWQ